MSDTKSTTTSPAATAPATAPAATAPATTEMKPHHKFVTKGTVIGAAIGAAGLAAFAHFKHKPMVKFAAIGLLAGAVLAGVVSHFASPHKDA